MTNGDDWWPVLERPVIFRSGREECYYKHFRTHNTPESVFVGSIVDEPSFWCQFHYLQDEAWIQKGWLRELWTNVVETLRQGFQLGSKNSLDGIIFWNSWCIKWENDLQKACSGPNSYLSIRKFRPGLKQVVTKGATYGETNDSVGHCDFEVLTGGSNSAF